jgi:hypothetical protein
LVPHSEQNQSASDAGFLAPQFWQKLPVQSAPQVHFHPPAGAGFLEPQFWQKLPVQSAPQAHLQPFAEAAAAFFSSSLAICAAFVCEALAMKDPPAPMPIPIPMNA